MATAVLGDYRDHRTNAHAPTKHIREWARANGYAVGNRAQLSREIKDAYAAAMAAERANELTGEP